MKKKSNLRHIILLIAVITGFTCMFTTIVQGKSTKWVFEATAVQIQPIEIEDEWWEGSVYNTRIERINYLYGTIDGIPFEGYNVINMHVKIDFATPTLELIANGKVTWYITWYGSGGLGGTFYGPVNTKGQYMGDLNSKIILQGAGDFNGWKLFGEVWNILGSWPPTNELSGTILIPN
jgi:hypothetical protein